MHKIRTLVGVLLLAVLGGVAARADEPVVSKVKAVETPVDTTVKPPAELAELKDMIGVWRCKGKVTIGGREVPSASTYTVIPELDGFVYVGRMEAQKTADLPAYKARDTYGYDSDSRTFSVFSVDNMGGWTTMTSKGWSGDKQEWTGKARTMGRDVEIKLAVLRKGPREIELSGTQGGTGPHPSAWGASCKK